MASDHSHLLDKMSIPENHIPVNELFTSVQGEGYHHGKAAFFIRFAGCDIGCSWCDSKDAWSIDESDFISVNSILAQIAASELNMIVITGGEPLIYDLSLLTKKIHQQGKHIHIETSGAYPLHAEFDWLTLSPKQVNLPQEAIYSKANELKIVISEKWDLDFALSEAEKVHTDCRLYLQPQWKNLKASLDFIMDFLQKNQNWRLSLQNHKFLGIK
jgi:7-carboxy-7-deazaguanine synthase